MTSPSLPDSMSPARANALAATFKPSWFAHFGEPRIAPQADAVSAHLVMDVGAAKDDAPIERRPVSRSDAPAAARGTPSGGPLSPSATRGRTSDAPPRAARPARAVAADPIELPTEGGNTGKIIIGVALAAAVVIGVVVFSSGEEPGTDPKMPATGQAKAQPQPPKTTAAKPAPVAAPVPEVKPEPEPEPVAQVDPPPVAAPEPVAAPKPVVKPPAPRPVPASAPKPKPASKPPPSKSPPPKPKPGSGSIVRDVPF